MSGLSRRGLLKGAAVVGAVSAVPLSARAMGGRKVVIFDSRLPQSLAFARTTTASMAIDLAEAHGARFALLRQGMPAGYAVEALTRWSDHVALRRELYRQGLRLSSEAASGGLVRWTMKPR